MPIGARIALTPLWSLGLSCFLPLSWLLSQKTLCPYTVHKHFDICLLYDTQVDGHHHLINQLLFAWSWSADWRWDSHTCRDTQIYQCAWKSGYPLRPVPCILCVHIPEVQPAAEQLTLLRAQLDVVMTPSLMAHSYENPLLFKSTMDWAVSIPAVTPDCHLWKLISQKSIPSFQSRIFLLCSTNCCTGLVREEKSKIQIGKINTCGANESWCLFSMFESYFSTMKI